MKKLTGIKLQMVIGLAVILAAVGIGSVWAVDIAMNRPVVAVEAPVETVEEEYRGFLHVDYEQQTGFLNTESIMASFYRIDYFSGDEMQELYKIEVSRWGFSRSLFHEVGTFQEAVEFLEMLQKGE